MSKPKDSIKQRLRIPEQENTIFNCLDNEIISNLGIVIKEKNFNGFQIRQTKRV